MCKALLCLCARKRDFCGSDVLRRSHFFYWQGSALRGGEREVFFPAMERTKDRRGTAPMSAYAERALIVPFPPVPLFTGAGPFGCLVNSGGQNQDLFPSYSRALGPFAIKICEGLLISYTAWCLPTCLVRSPSIARLPRLCQTRRCTYSADTSEFLLCRGLCPRGKKGARSCLRPPESYGNLAGGRPP